jgi:hypothetical protein
MGILKTIFGGGNVIKEGFELIDSMHTSKEEEIAAKSKAKTDLLTAYAPFKVAQRYLALMFGGTFLLSFFLVLGMTLLDKGNPEDIKVILGEFYLGEIMMTIVLFYFGGGAFEGGVNAFKKRKVKD